MPVNVFWRRGCGVVRDRLAESLGEIRMTMGPMNDPCEQRAAVPVFIHTRRERSRFRLGEILEIYPTADIEWRDLRIAHEATRCGDPKQAEGEFVEVPMARPEVVTLPDSSEELIGGELQRANDVDLVNKDNQAVRATGKNDVLQRRHPSLHGT